MSAGNSMSAKMIAAAGTAVPPSFNDDSQLFGSNLFLMTTFMCLGLMMAGKMALAIVRHWRRDRVFHPVTIWRAAWFLAGAAAFVRCGADAMILWAWNPDDVTTTACVMMAKHWIDPVALMLAGGWMLLVTLSNTSMEQQLRKRPYPVDMLARLPALRRPAVVILLSLVAAVGVAWTR